RGSSPNRKCRFARRARVRRPALSSPHWASEVSAPAMASARWTRAMKLRILAEVSIGLLAIALVPALAQGQTTAPITEWTVPIPFDIGFGFAIDKNGDVWFTGSGFFSTSGQPQGFSSTAFVKLHPSTGTFSFWVLPHPSDNAHGVAPAPDGTVFVLTGTDLGRLNPHTDALTRWRSGEGTSGLTLDVSSPQNPLLWVGG